MWDNIRKIFTSGLPVSKPIKMANIVDKKLIRRLIKNGVEPSLIPGFIRSLANACLIHPDISHFQANKRLKYLGWHDVELDYHTMQLAIDSLESKGLRQLEYKSAPWYLDGFQTLPPGAKSMYPEV